MSKIVAIRIKGRVGVPEKLERTFNLLRLKKKFSCVIVDEKPELLGMLKKAHGYIAYGHIGDGTIKKMEKRFKASTKNYALHPPRGGFKKSTKLQWPKGVLGHNKDINQLIERML